MATDLEPIVKLSRDLKAAAVTLSATEARYLVDHYYTIQEYRKSSRNQILALSKASEPHEVLRWFADNAETLEAQVKRALMAYAEADSVGKWSMSIMGIGPVIAAGLLAHIDITKAPTVGHIWRFAGLDPSRKWEKGQKRPWNADLKTLCWKIGQSFLKTMNNENSEYGKLFQERWAIEKANNESGKYAEQAAKKLIDFKIGKTTDAYKAYAAGILPPAHILQRSLRWTEKLFLSHWHEVAYWEKFGTAPPRLYVIEHMGHTDKIPVPNWGAPVSANDRTE